MLLDAADLAFYVGNSFRSAETLTCITKVPPKCRQCLDDTDSDAPAVASVCIVFSVAAASWLGGNRVD
jgi:hypothetical protein